MAPSNPPPEPGNEPGTPPGEPGTPPADDGMATDAGKRALKAERDRVKALEAQLADLKPLADAARAAEDANKTEVQRLTEENAQLKKDLGTATVTGARLKVALDKGLTATQAKRLVGDTEEELAADADELLEDLGAKPGEGTPAPPPGAKPSERLKPGNGNPEEPVAETDLKKLGARMFES